MNCCHEEVRPRCYRWARFAWETLNQTLNKLKISPSQCTLLHWLDFALFLLQLYKEHNNVRTAKQFSRDTSFNWMNNFEKLYGSRLLSIVPKDCLMLLLADFEQIINNDFIQLETEWLNDIGTYLNFWNSLFTWS